MSCQKQIPSQIQNICQGQPTGVEAANLILNAAAAHQAALFYWNNCYRNWDKDHIKCDDWLNKFEELINSCQTPIIDLGCGEGNDVLTLCAMQKK